MIFLSGNMATYKCHAGLEFVSTSTLICVTIKTIIEKKNTCRDFDLKKRWNKIQFLVFTQLKYAHCSRQLTVLRKD